MRIQVNGPHPSHTIKVNGPDNYVPALSGNAPAAVIAVDLPEEIKKENVKSVNTVGTQEKLPTKSKS